MVHLLRGVESDCAERQAFMRLSAVALRKTMPHDDGTSMAAELSSI
jgi:hypothetical protein